MCVLACVMYAFARIPCICECRSEEGLWLGSYRTGAKASKQRLEEENPSGLAVLVFHVSFVLDVRRRQYSG